MELSEDMAEWRAFPRICPEIQTEGLSSAKVTGRGGLETAWQECKLVMARFGQVFKGLRGRVGTAP